MSIGRRTFIAGLVGTTAMALGQAAFPPNWRTATRVVMTETPLPSKSERVVAAIESTMAHMRQRAREISDTVWSEGTSTRCTGLALLLGDGDLQPAEIGVPRAYEESAWG